MGNEKYQYTHHGESLVKPNSASQSGYIKQAIETMAREASASPKPIVCDNSFDAVFTGRVGSQNDIWFCPACETKNESNFCAKCGTKKPQ